MTAPTRPVCPEPELLTALVDHELDHTDRDAVLSHVASCGDCRSALEAERRVKSAVRDLNEAVAEPSAALLVALRAIPQAAPEAPSAVVSLQDRREARAPRRAPAFFAAAASVVVFMVGAFAYLGASGPAATPDVPTGGVAIVPAADRLTLEHAATNAQTNLGGPAVSTVSVTVPLSTPTAVAR